MYAVNEQWTHILRLKMMLLSHCLFIFAFFLYLFSFHEQKCVFIHVAREIWMDKMFYLHWKWMQVMRRKINKTEVMWKQIWHHDHEDGMSGRHNCKKKESITSVSYVLLLFPLGIVNSQLIWTRNKNSFFLLSFFCLLYKNDNNNEGDSQKLNAINSNIHGIWNIHCCILHIHRIANKKENTSNRMCAFLIVEEIKSIETE